MDTDVGRNVAYFFWNGGPRSVSLGYFIVISGVLCQVSSLAEMSSVQAIAGAQYHWTYYLAPASHRRFITWMQGWITWFSWISLLAGVVNIAALMVQTLVSASYPDYVPKGWHVTLIIYAMLITQGLMNQFLFFLLPWMELLAGLLHIITWVVFVSVLVTLAPRHSSEFVFLEKTSGLSGWNNDYISFNLGMLTATWGFVGKLQCDGCRSAHSLMTVSRLRWRGSHVRGSTKGATRCSSSNVLEYRDEWCPGIWHDPRDPVRSG